MIKDYFLKISLGLQHAVDLSLAALKAPKFIKDHKLWTGFFDHKWVTLFSFIIAILFSHLLIKNIMAEFDTSERAEIIDDAREEVSEVLKDLQEEHEVLADNERINDEIKKHGRSFFFSGGMKYLLLIFMEVLIFHFAVKSYSILKGKEVKLVANDFYKAEIRMIKVMFLGVVKTFVANVLLSIFTKMFGLDFLKAPAMFFVVAYFLGHAFLDNYNEQHELSIKDSDKIIQTRFGASTALGVIASIIMIVPIIGPLVAPLFCSVIATLYGYTHQLEHVPVPISKKKRKKAKKVEI